MNGLFFGPDFHFDLDWKSHPLRLGSVLPSHRAQISQSLKDLSAESIRNRFMGSKKEFSPQELEYLTNLDGWNHYAIGIEERDRPRGVAIVRMVRSSSNPLEAEVAITIIDEYQKLGLGSVLMKFIAMSAFERNLEQLSFTFMPQNEGIIRLIQKIGKSSHGSDSAMDYVQLCVNLKDVNFEGLKHDLLELHPPLAQYQPKFQL